MIRKRKRTPLSHWATLVEKVVDLPGAASAVYHNFEVADYAVILARTPSGLIPIVRQFRPAIEERIWEFPGGLVDEGESGQSAALRELFEETGLRSRRCVSLGAYWSDSGRLNNRTHAFYVDAEEPLPDFKAEANITVRFVTEKELLELIEGHEFCHALHVATYYLARGRALL